MKTIFIDGIALFRKNLVKKIVFIASTMSELEHNIETVHN